LYAESNVSTALEKHHKRVYRIKHYARPRFEAGPQIPETQHPKVEEGVLAGPALQAAIRRRATARTVFPELAPVLAAKYTGVSNKRRSTQGHAFWNKMDKWTLKYGWLASRSQSQRRRHRKVDINQFKTRILAYFGFGDNASSHLTDQRVRMWLEAGYVRGAYGSKCLPGPAPRWFEGKYAHLINILKNGLNRYCTEKGWRGRVPYKRMIRLPAVEASRDVKRGPLNESSKVIVTDKDFSTKLAAALHRLRMIVLGKRYTKKPVGGSRPTLLKAHRRCDPRSFADTGVEVRMKITQSAIDDLDESEVRAALRKLRKHLKDESPKLFQAVRARVHGESFRGTFSRRQDNLKIYRMYPFPVGVATRGHPFKVQATIVSVIDMTALIMALLMENIPSNVPGEAEIDVQNKPRRGMYLARVRIDMGLGLRMLGELLEKKGAALDARFFYALELVASTQSTLKLGTVLKLLENAENEKSVYVGHIKGMSEIMHCTEFDVCTMLAYTPVHVWGSYTSHANDRISVYKAKLTTRRAIEDIAIMNPCRNIDGMVIKSHGAQCRSGRSTGGTQSNACGGVMYLQKMPTGYDPQASLTSRQRIPGQRTVRLDMPRPTKMGMTTSPPPDVWRALYNPWVSRPGYQCSVNVEVNDNVEETSTTEPMVFCSDGELLGRGRSAYKRRRPVFGDARTYAESREKWRAYIKAVVSERDAKTLFKLLHKDFRTLRDKSLV